MFPDKKVGIPEAIDLWIKVAKEDGVQIPEPNGKLMYA
jgi:predicted RNase H-like HicB family nuclease